MIKASKTFSNIPWSSIVTSGPVWALTIAKIGHDWVFYCLTTYMPKYLFDVLNLPINIVTRYCTIPYFLLWIVSLASAALGDYLVSHKKLTVTQSRKIFTTIGKTFLFCFGCRNKTIFSCCNSMYRYHWCFIQ